MLKKILQFEYILPLMVLAGVAQYGYVAYAAITSGNISLWTIDASDLDSSGYVKYTKDLFILFFSLAWLIFLPRLYINNALKRLVKKYFIWFVLVITCGLIAFVLEYSPLFFLASGLRWMLLLHASFGVFLLTSSLFSLKSNHKLIFNFLIIILLVNLYVALLQLKLSGNLFGTALGEARVTGLFSQAGVAATFAIGIALMVSVLVKIKVKWRILTISMCMFLALLTGTRYAVAVVFIVLLGELWLIVENSEISIRKYLKLLFLICALSISILGYDLLIMQVNRGDAISQQFGQGGRVANFIDALDMIYYSEILEFFFGRGLGIGTNTAIGGLYNSGADPYVYKYNILVDNAVLTNFFQFGLIGSLIFWFGIIRLLRFSKPRHKVFAKVKYVVVVVSIGISILLGSPFEQYFLMIAFALVLGAAYWYDRYEFKN